MTKKNEAQALRAALGIFSKPVLAKVDEVGFLGDVYVKALSVKEGSVYLEKLEAIQAAEKDEYKAVRHLAMDMYDADGKPIFNPNDDEDMKVLAELPIPIVTLIQSKSNEINTPDGLKNALAAGKSSS